MNRGTDQAWLCVFWSSQRTGVSGLRFHELRHDARRSYVVSSATSSAASAFRNH